MSAVLGSARRGNLHEHLVRAGHVTETGVMRRVTARSCRRCGGPVIVGLDAMVGAFEATADPQPLNRIGEAVATLEGRRTWALNREEARYVLNPRDALEIAYHPATSRAREDVVREHRCRTPSPPNALTAPSSFTPAIPPLPAGAPAPF